MLGNWKKAHFCHNKDITKTWVYLVLDEFLHSVDSGFRLIRNNPLICCGKGPQICQVKKFARPVVLLVATFCRSAFTFSVKKIWFAYLIHYNVFLESSFFLLFTLLSVQHVH